MLGHRSFGMWGGPFGEYGANSLNTWYPWVHLIGTGIFALTVILALVIILRKAGKIYPIHFKKNPALETLQIRYAKGEITSEEYQRIKADLLS